MLRTQILEDQQGAPMGIFIPIKEWENIKYYYPEIEYYDAPLPQWEKDFIDNRLSALNTHPEKIKPIENLFDNL